MTEELLDAVRGRASLEDEGSTGVAERVGRHVVDARECSDGVDDRAGRPTVPRGMTGKKIDSTEKCTVRVPRHCPLSTQAGRELRPQERLIRRPRRDLDAVHVSTVT